LKTYKIKKSLKEIKPGIGLGNIKFGMKRAEVKLMLGEPSKIDAYSNTDSDEDLTESWEYNDLNISLSFFEEEDWKLLMISVYDGFYQLEGKSLIGLNKKTLVAELNKINFGEIDMDDSFETDFEDEEFIEVQEKSMNFWFSNAILDEIRWTPNFMDDDTIN
jgi:hypothetical protein